MPSNPGAFRIARATRTSVNNGTETDEINFALSRNEGVEIYSIEFAYNKATLLGGDPAVLAEIAFSVHIETGGLEGGIQSFPADTHILNSEILAEAVLTAVQYDNATQGSYSRPDWTGQSSWDYFQKMGKPFLIAQNLTFRVIAPATFTVTGAQATIIHRYVRLTDQELGRLGGGFR